MKLPWLYYVPVHVFPLPVYPGLQVQWYEPITLLHCAFTWQGEGEVVHSSMSAANMKNISIKIGMKKLIECLLDIMILLSQVRRKF